MDTSPTDEPFEAAAICEGDPFIPLSLTRVVTESSVWLLDPVGIDGAGRYLRMPRDEAPRCRTHSAWDRLEDGKWLEYEYARWTSRGLRPGEFRLNIKPVIGPPLGYGIETGRICEIDSRQLV
jgi:hypothetical protein